MPAVRMARSVPGVGTLSFRYCAKKKSIAKFSGGTFGATWIFATITTFPGIAVKAKAQFGTGVGHWDEGPTGADMLKVIVKACPVIANAALFQPPVALAVK